MAEDGECFKENQTLYFYQLQVVKTPASLSQGILEILELVHMLVHDQVGTLIYVSFQGSMGVEPTKNTPCLHTLGTWNCKDIGELGRLNSLTTMHCS
ncbi:hypothetical protein MXB_5329 [Myxobolus squamalis]|nr:hypothetical protein MXB_5329 [Myxobolus squamalis]